MSGIDARHAARIAEIAAELRADVADLRAIHAQLDAFLQRLHGVDAHDPAVHSAVALWLDHYYTAVEALLLRLLAALDGTPASGDDWHSRLLRLATLDIPGTRPAILRPEVREPLDQLRAFRHKVRHTYVLTLEPVRLGSLGDLEARLHPELVQDLDQFARRLLAVALGTDLED